MKKILSITFICVFANSFSQTSNPFLIEHCIDKMTDNEYYMSQRKLICSNEAKTKGFTILPMFKKENGIMINNGFYVENVNIGNCDEKDNLIFLFEDDSKFNITAWNKFNCEGNSYFDITEEQLKELSTKKISMIRFINGINSDSLTYTLKNIEKDYFVRAYSNNKILEVNCNK